MSAYGEKRLISTDNWPRYEHFRHFYDEAPCAISLCDDIDVTELRGVCQATKRSFYLAMLYCVTSVVNAHEEFRMTVADAPEWDVPHPAVWDCVNPVHNLFHEDTETFTSLFSLWNPDFTTFTRDAGEDLSRAASLYTRSIPCAGNTFEVSCLPWRHFTAVGITCDSEPLTPTVVWGGFCTHNCHTSVPLSIRIHHAAADGFHLARFLNETEATCAALAKQLLKESVTL